MRLLIDLQSCQNGSAGRGIGRVALALTRAIAAAPRRPDVRVLLSGAFPGTIAPLRRALADLLPPDRILICAMPGRTASADPGNAWRTRAAELLLADFIAAQAPDMLFVPSLFEGFWDAMVTGVEPAPYRTAVLIHDFIPLDNQAQYLPGPGIRAAYHRKMRAAASADLLLANSRHTAGEAAARLGMAAERVVTIPLGIDPGFRPPPPGLSAEAALARAGIDRPFVLNTSPFEPRKNLEGLIAGFAAMPPALRAGHQLVIVGKMDAVARRTLNDVATRAGLGDGTLVLPGFVPDADLVTLYGATALFAFPSFGEGFGLPVLEAMACGAPVIGSDTTSIPEVIGRADLLCDPARPAAIGAAMARVLGDPALAAELRVYGPERSAGFSWANAAEIMLDRFAAAVADAPAPAVRARPSRPGRPSLAFVTEGWAMGDIEAMTRRLDADFAVTPVLADGRLDDPFTAANFAARDFAWFERHAPAFDRILYAADGAMEAIGPLIAEFPGVLLTGPNASPLTRSWADRATASASGVDPKGSTAALREVILRAGEAGDDHRRAFAARLPRAVRDMRASDDDLARLARAFARNEAYRRPPRLLVDLTETPDRIRNALFAALSDAGGDAVAGVVADGEVVRLADNGETNDRDQRLPFRLRAGDKLIGIDRLGGLSSPLRAMRTVFVEAGVTLSTVDTTALKPTDDQSMASKIMKMIDGQTSRLPENMLHASNHEGSKDEPDISIARLN